MEKWELLQTVDVPLDDLKDVKISGDGSNVFCLHFHTGGRGCV